MRAHASRIVLTLLAATALALASSPAVEATHATACNYLSTSGSCPGMVSFNPRQECINAIPGHVQGPPRNAAVAVCNRLSTSEQRPGQVSCNPRAECVAKLPPTPTVSITSVGGGVGGGDKTWPETNEVFTVHGHNVGLPGGTLTKQGSGFTVGYGQPQAGCAPPDCVAVAVSVGNVHPGDDGVTRHFRLTMPFGHSSATGTFHIVKQPPPRQQYRASTGGSAAPASPRVITGTATYARNVSLDIAGCSPSVLTQGGTVTCQIMAKVTGPALATAVQGAVAESMPGVHYINISPSSFTIPASQSGSAAFAVATINLTAAPFSDPNQSPGIPAPGSQPYRATAPFRAWAVYPESSGSGTKTAEAVTGVIVEAQR